MIAPSVGGTAETERSGGQKGRGLESGRPPGIFARPRFPIPIFPPPPNFVPVKLARHLIITQSITPQQPLAFQIKLYD